MGNTDKIEELAFKLKYEKLSDGRRSALESKLLFLVMVEMKLMTSRNEINEQHYDGIMFNNSYTSAMRDYGKKDSETGLIIPFLKIIWHNYKLNTLSLRKEQKKEEQGVGYKLSENAIKLFLKETARSLGVKDFKLPRNVKNFDAVKKLLIEIEADEKTLGDFEAIFYKQLKVSNDSKADDAECSGDKVSDSTGLEDFNNKEKTINLICDSIDNTFRNIENKTERRYAKFALTMIWYQTPIDCIELRDCIDKYIDKNYCEYYSLHCKDEPKDEIILARYLGKKTESVEKRLREAKKNFAAYLL